MTRTLAEVMAPVRHVLLDFDGPVCSVFGELPAPVVARRLAEAIDAGLPDEVVGTDPLALLSVFAERGRETLVQAEAKLRDLEVEAVQTAPTTPGAVEALQVFRDTGRTVTIVSNNSQIAVVAFLADRGLKHLVTGVCSRQHPEPELLKPNPFLLRRAIVERDAVVDDCIMIGDSSTDIAAARAASVAILAYAKCPEKRARLGALRPPPDLVIGDLARFSAELAPL
ncbi:HAD family hydrolase [Actinomycetospora endophytica]|uniref:HAD family hydrolase n=1 Tax=Actinomycetospora endophytica TaxID=2291215 RepID=A0ABS8P546_9PSEU|nr:HAD hydrolase-like protein [Actinomycetospora endophytica]MCD2193153.1 HAD family hydrolase [Actinomycetospora endophytica]